MKKDLGFVVLLKNGKQCPTIVCEKCGEAITDVGLAGVVWQEQDREEGSCTKVTVLCKKNHCLTSEPYRHLPWQEFGHYALWLLYNSGLKTEKQIREAWKAAEEMDALD